MSQLQNGSRKSRKLAGSITAVVIAAFVGTSVSACNGTVDGHAVVPDLGASSGAGVVADLNPVGPHDAQGYLDLLHSRVEDAGSPQVARKVFWNTMCQAGQDLGGVVIVPPDMDLEGVASDEFGVFIFFMNRDVVPWIQDGVLPQEVATQDLYDWTMGKGTVCDIAARV